TEYGVAPAHFADEVARASTSIEVSHVYEEEERIGHVVRALVNCIRERIDEPLRPFVHLFATSNDITDTATALRLKELTRDVLLPQLRLRPADAPVATQVVHPEYVTDLVHALVSTFSVMANLADDIRHLHRSEIDETQEIYDEARVGSSTMPHKLNPKNFEFVKSMWKEFMPRMMTVYMDQISEHQRDLTNSASSRFLAEFFTAFVYSLDRLRDAMKNLDVDNDAMKKNLATTQDEPLAVHL